MPPADQMMRHNYHTHMYLCRHAEGTVEDYVRKAIDLGFQTIGMSDHAPFPELQDRSVRMYVDELETYIGECERAVLNYGDRIRVLKGIEIEFFPKYASMYDKLKDRLDYLALGQHYVDDPGNRNDLCSAYAINRPDLMETYVRTLEEAIASRRFRFVCHPDLMLYGWGTFDATAQAASERIIAAAVRHDVPLEVNANGIRKGMRKYPEGIRYIYPRKEFWQLAGRMGAKIIVGSDAHTPSQLWDAEVEACYEFLSVLGLRAVEVLPI